MSKAGQVEAMMSYRMKARERKTILSIFNPLTKEKVSYKNVKNLYTNNIIAIYISSTFCSTFSRETGTSRMYLFISGGNSREYTLKENGKLN